MDNVHNPPGNPAPIRPVFIAYGMPDITRSMRWYKLRVGNCIKYLEIAPDTFPVTSWQDLLDHLPPIPYHEDTWKVATVSRQRMTRGLNIDFRIPVMPQVEETWHPTMVDIDELQFIKPLGQRTHECREISDPLQRLIIAKVARFPWEIRYLQSETAIYRNLKDTQLAPQVLGHIREEGRVVGILLEKIQGRHAKNGDIEICYAALDRLHARGIAHGDFHSHNVIITEDNRAMVIDFETSHFGASEADMEQDVGDLALDLAET